MKLGEKDIKALLRTLDIDTLEGRVCEIIEVWDIPKLIKHIYNQALEDAADNVELEYSDTGNYGKEEIEDTIEQTSDNLGNITFISKKSILKLKL